MQDSEPLTSDTLFLACTRPAMFAGVTVEAMGINVFVTTLLFLGLGSIVYALTGVVLHGLCRLIVRHDHNAFRVLAGWADTKGRYRSVLGRIERDATAAQTDVRFGRFAPWLNVPHS